MYTLGLQMYHAELDTLINFIQHCTPNKPNNYSLSQGYILPV